MPSLQDLQRPLVRVVMFITVLIEIYLIGANYNATFDDYITILVILLAIPASYFAYHLLRNKNKEVEPHDAILRTAVPKDASEETREEVEKLLRSEKYREYQRRKEKKMGKKASEDEGEEEQDDSDKEIDEIAKQLEEKEQQIYDI